jgi:hypothetical protein
MLRYLSVILAAGTLLGCSSGTPGEVKLGVDVAAMVTKTSGSTTTTTNASSDTALVVNRVRVLVHEVKIGYTGGNPSGGPVAEAGPYVVDLTADEIANGAHREFSLGTVASGTYGGAEIEIEPLYASDDTSDPALADFVTTGAAVLIDGTYNGTAFQFAGHFLAEQGTDGQVTVDAATPVALSLTIDPSTWLKDANGNFVDPTDATQHDAEAVAICKTLDTELQSGPAAGGGMNDGSGMSDGDCPTGAGGAPSGSGGAPAGGKPHHGGHGGPGGGGGKAHCVEASTTAS